MKTPQVGWGADHHLLGDIYPGVIVEVKSPTRVIVECLGHREEVSRRKNGYWISKGASIRSAGFWSLYSQ